MNTYISDLQRKYGDKGLASNICIPTVAAGGIPGQRLTSKGIDMRVLLGDPEDCERIMRVHIRKDDTMQNALFDSIISTTDFDNWREQRNHFNEAFLPIASLSRILPVSLNRARDCAERLGEQSQ